MLLSNIETVLGLLASSTLSLWDILCPSCIQRAEINQSIEPDFKGLNKFGNLPIKRLNQTHQADKAMSSVLDRSDWSLRAVGDKSVK